jgi:hypothetical protein
MKLHFWTDGDRSTGIAGDKVTIDLNLEGHTDAETGDNVAHAKEVLSKALADIWDNGTVHASTNEDAFERASRISKKFLTVTTGIQDISKLTNS